MKNPPTDFLFSQFTEDWIGFEEELDENLIAYLPQRNEFGDYMFSCNLEDYFSQLVSLFLDRFPNIGRLFGTLVNSHYDNGEFVVDGALRLSGDIKKIEFIVNEANEEQIGAIQVDLVAVEPNLALWIEKIISPKSWQVSISGMSKSYVIWDCPLSGIEVKEDSAKLLINPEMIIEYD
ncbi:MAG: hypothetical protein H6581_27205 [Bacteroidia bacterium]|nr:hypothetical protein [Bacteroidia bacterium]